MVLGIRDWAVTMKMGFLKIEVAVVLKIQHQRTGELEVTFSVSDARGGGI